MGIRRWVLSVAPRASSMFMVPVSDEQSQAWTDSGKASYVVQQMSRPTPGPAIRVGFRMVVTVRLDEERLAALLKRATNEGITNRSEVVRAAIEQWDHVAA